MFRSALIATLTAAGTLAMTLLHGCAAHAPAAPAAPDVHAGWITFHTTVNTDGHDRPCPILVPGPATPRPDPGYPAILFLHGRGECGVDGIRQLVVGLPPAALADPGRWPFVIIAPQKPIDRDSWQQHESYALACLDAACRDFKIDRSRVYLTGLSQGGAGTWAIGSRHPELFAAIAPVCGFVHDPAGTPSGIVQVGDDTQRREIAARLAAASMPIWTFHGEKDDVVLPAQTRALVAAVESAGGSVKVTYLPNANHNAWDPAYRDNGAALAEWLLSNQKKP